MNVAYLRVSSRTQDVATQRDAIERAARARGEAIDDWRAESASGRTMDRPVLAGIREHARHGLVRVLWCYRLDRLTRSGIRDTLALLEELRGAGCAVRTVADGFSLDGPGAELIAAVMGWAAQMERGALAERVAAARTRVEAKGGRWGRPPRMTPREVARAVEMSDAGRSVRQIAVALKVPRSTVQETLRAARAKTTER